MKVLLLAGTSEARSLAQLLADMPGITATASLAGATRTPQKLALPTRHGGFGGKNEQISYIKNNGFDVIIDATHPFANQISNRTAHIARHLGVACLHLVRPPWRAAPGDDWTEIDTATQAPLFIPPGAQVFLATGRQILPDFANLNGRYLICRQLEAPEQEFPFENGEFLVEKPPFSVADEVALFRTRNIDWLVVKNAGGSLSRSKLEAARKLEIPVLMIKRPPPPPGEIVESVPAVIGWLKAHIVHNT